MIAIGLSVEVLSFAVVVAAVVAVGFVLETFLLCYCLRRDNLGETLQAWGLQPCVNVLATVCMSRK